MDNNGSEYIVPETSPIHLVPVPWDWRLILQLILAITGILGNSLVVHIYLNTRELKKKTTNTFIAALAGADLVTSISLTPFPLLSRVSANIMWISIVASIFTLTTLAVERYVAVAFPSRYRLIFNRRNSLLIILAIWIFGIVINTFEYYGFWVVNQQCAYILPSSSFQKFLGIAVFLVEFLIPIIIMLVTNCRTIQILNANSASFMGKSDDQSRAAISLLRARRRVVNMLMVVIITFIVCWAPDQIAYLVFNLGLVPVYYLFGPIYRAVVVLAFANSCLNPFIYVLTNNNFRKALRAVFRFKGGRIRPLTDEDGDGMTNGETDGQIIRVRTVTENV